jgi:hypothetical protein
VLSRCSRSTCRCSNLARCALYVGRHDYGFQRGTFFENVADVPASCAMQAVACTLLRHSKYVGPAYRPAFTVRVIPRLSHNSIHCCVTCFRFEWILQAVFLLTLSQVAFQCVLCVDLVEQVSYLVVFVLWNGFAVEFDPSACGRRGSNRILSG